MQLYDSNEYRASKDWPYAISAGCVVYREVDGQIQALLLKRTPDHSYNMTNKDTYNLPKGHVDLTERLDQAAQRETEEEAGCESEITTYLGAHIRSFLLPKYQVPNEKTTHYFAAVWKRDLDTIDSEHDEKVWVSIEKAKKLLGQPNPKGEDEFITRLEKFLELTRAS